MDDDKYNPKRALKLVQSEPLLNKVWNKVPKHYDKPVALQSIFKSLIKPSKEYMDKYRKTI